MTLTRGQGVARAPRLGQSFAATVLIGVALAALAYLWIDTRAVLSPEGGACTSRPWGRPLVAACVLAVAGFAALAARARAVRYRRVKTPSVVWLGAYFAISAAVLGTAVYWSPTSRWQTGEPLARVLQLFLGSIEEGLCQDRYPVGAWTALAFAISATGTGILAAAANTWRGAWDRLAVRLGSGLDVVVGADPRMPALVDALLDDRRRPGSATREVVLLTTDVDEATRMRTAHPDLRVVNIDSSSQEEMRRVIFGRSWLLRRRVSFNRLFLLHADQQRNVAVHDAVVAAIESSHLLTDDRQVPRIVVRMDDAREARDWRARENRPGVTPACFSDAVSHDEILAGELTEFIERRRSRNVVIVGQTSLALALLDELTLRRRERTELRELQRQWVEDHPGQECSATLRDELGLDELVSVRVVGDPAGVLREWQHTRPTHDHAVRLPASTVPTLRAAVDELGGAPTTVVVTASDFDEMPALRSLVREQRGAWTALVPHDSAVGVPRGAQAEQVVRYGPTWTPGGTVVEDSWTVLARHQHAAYRHAHGLGEPTPENATAAIWTRGRVSDLPAFFQLDNLRQHRHVLQTFVTLGYRWRFESHGGTHPVPEADLLEVARSEHRRWRALREAHGWTRGPRDDARRKNPHLVDWDSLPADRRDTTMIAAIVRRLGENGVVLEPAWTHRRAGVVEAHRLEKDLSWTASDGSTLHSTAGDWWVTDSTGGGRGVAHDRFIEQHVDCGDGRYRRVGLVVAQRLESRTTVNTLEGRTHGETGDWLVFDGTTRWVAADHHFTGTYEPLEPLATA